MEPPRNEPLRVLFVLVLLAGLVRLSAALSAGVMNDEAFSFFAASRPLEEMSRALRADLNPPTWYVLLKPLVQITSDPLILRLPSVLLGLLAVVCVFLIGRRVLGNGLLPGLVAAAAYPLWLAEAQIRQYGLLDLAAAVAMVLALKASRQRLSGAEWAGYLAATCWMPVVHYGGFLILVALGLGLALAPALPDRRRMLLATALGALPGLGWFAWSLLGPIQPDVVDAGNWSLRLAHIADLPAYLTGLSLPAAWPGLRDLAPAWTGRVLDLLGLALWALWARGCVSLVRRGQRSEALLLGLGFLLSLVGFLAGEALGVQPFQPRYLVPVAAFFVTLMLVGAGRYASTLVALVVLVNLATAAFFPRDPFLWNQDWPGAVEWIREREQAGDVLAVSMPYALMGLNFTYARERVQVDFSRPGQMGFRFDEGYRGLPQVPLPAAPPEARPGPGRVFLVLCPFGDPDLIGLVDWFNRNYRVLDARIQPCVNQWGATAVFLLEPVAASDSRRQTRSSVRQQALLVKESRGAVACALVPQVVPMDVRPVVDALGTPQIGQQIQRGHSPGARPLQHEPSGPAAVEKGLRETGVLQPGSPFFVLHLQRGRDHHQNQGEPPPGGLGQDPVQVTGRRLQGLPHLPGVASQEPGLGKAGVQGLRSLPEHRAEELPGLAAGQHPTKPGTA